MLLLLVLLLLLLLALARGVGVSSGGRSSSSPPPLNQLAVGDLGNEGANPLAASNVRWPAPAAAAARLAAVRRSCVSRSISIM